MNKNSIFDLAIKKWGKKPQIDMINEEVGELLQAVNKIQREKDPTKLGERRDNLAEEIADVELVLQQLKRIYKLENKVSYFKRIKLKRLFQRLQK